MIEIQNTLECYLRLPCGVCRLTMTDCPKLNQYVTTLTGRHFDIDKILDEMKGTRTDDDTY